MKKILINGCPAIIGENIKFGQVPFFHIQPGTRIIQIGDGTKKFNNKPMHTDSFKHPVTYMGSIQMNKAIFFAFQLDPKANELSSPVYLLYQKDAEFIFKTNYREENVFLRMAPSFTLDPSYSEEETNSILVKLTDGMKRISGKVTVIASFLLLSLGAQAQQSDTTAADTTVHCIESKLVWNLGIAAAIIFYAENNKGEANAWHTLIGIHRKNKANYYE